MQEAIWDKGGIENAEEYGSFLAGGNISFSRTPLLEVSCSLSEIFACYILPCVSFHVECYSEIASLSCRLA